MRIGKCAIVQRHFRRARAIARGVDWRDRVTVLATPELAAACPGFCAGDILCRVANTAHDAALWEQIAAACAEARAQATLDT
jgi:hypothetical protein